MIVINLAAMLNAEQLVEFQESIQESYIDNLIEDFQREFPDLDFDSEAGQEEWERFSEEEDSEIFDRVERLYARCYADEYVPPQALKLVTEFDLGGIGYDLCLSSAAEDNVFLYCVAAGLPARVA